MQGGDVVEAVDGKAVTCETLVDAIRGADMPGSKMEMQLRGPDKTLRTVALLRQPRAQVIERRDLFLLLDEMRGMASTHALEQRGKKKPDEPLIRFLNKSVDDLTITLRKISAFESAAQDKERELRDFLERVKGVTNQYLGRLEYALRAEEDDGLDVAVPPSKDVGEGEADAGADTGGEERNPSRGTGPASTRLEELEKRAADAEAALVMQQQAHASVMLRMQAEVQSLQDQLAFARAVGDEPSATNSDDVTLSGQLSRAKTKMAKLEAELAVAKESLQAKNVAINASRQETQAALDSGKADREALKACRQSLAQAQHDLKTLEKLSAQQRLAAGGAGGGRESNAAVVATLESQISTLTKEVVAAQQRAVTAEKSAAQAKEEARILLRKRQADQSALAQVDVDVMAFLSACGKRYDVDISLRYTFICNRFCV